MEQSKFYQIKNITEREYTLVGCDGSVITRPIQDVDKSASAFTIQDAKEGDVLAMSAGAFIYNGNRGGGSCPGCYCGINTLGNFKVGVEHHWTGKPVFPATKEQRDTLMKVMANAGYIFDFEKKELKKIEQGLAWSEEDETKIKSIIALLKSPALCTMDGNKGIIDENIKYLKSIKERCTWKPSDEQIEALKWQVNNTYSGSWQYKFSKELLEQLKKLRNE